MIPLWVYAVWAFATFMAAVFAYVAGGASGYREGYCDGVREYEAQLLEDLKARGDR